MFHVLASDRSGFKYSVFSSIQYVLLTAFPYKIVCSMFKRLIGLVCMCAYVPCLSV